MPLAESSSARPLPPVAREIDGSLAEIDTEIDWLTALSPIDNDAMWTAFQASGFSEAPKLEYAPSSLGIDLHRERLKKLPMLEIEDPILAALFREKQRELERQIDLVSLRDTPGFIAASIDLFGGTEPLILTRAKSILARVAGTEEDSESVGCHEVVTAVEADFAWYRERAPDFEGRLVIDDDLNSLMMVSRGTFHVARSVRVPKARIGPLIAHEIGTHVVTHYNGSQQSLRQLRVGLAHYDALQEGLGALAEYIAGYLSPNRLRVLAARVVATQMAIDGRSVLEIFEALHRDERLPAEDAFDVAVRACRGGGLTKDAVYLRGLCDLLAYLADGGELEFLHLGKFALSHRSSMNELKAQGWVVAPALLPRHLENASGRARLARAREAGVESLFQSEPEA